MGWVRRHIAEKGAPAFCHWRTRSTTCRASPATRRRVGIAMRDDYCVVNFAVVTGGYGLAQWEANHAADEAHSRRHVHGIVCRCPQGVPIAKS